MARRKFSRSGATGGLSTRAKKHPNQQFGRSLYRRQLRIEPLEERRLLAVVTVTTLADTIDFNDGVTSLREAIFATNTVPGADTIEFAPALTAGGPARILLTQGEFAITDSLTIEGPGASLLTLDARSGSRILSLDGGGPMRRIDVAVQGITMSDGYVGDAGGGILSVDTDLTIVHCVLSGNAANTGGGVLSRRGNLTVEDSAITGNTSKNEAGGVGQVFRNFGRTRQHR